MHMLHLDVITRYSYRRSRTLSVPAIHEQHFPALMLKLGGGDPTKDDHYKWAYRQWWDVWFPEVLKESNEGIICT